MSTLKSYKVFPVSLPDEDPKWKFAGRAYPAWDACILALQTEEGQVGHGYAASFAHLGATNAGTEAALHRLVPPILGKNPLDIEANLGLVDKAIQGNHVAKSAIDCALYDLAANLLSRPLHDLFGGAMRRQIPLCRMLSLKSPREMAERARERHDEGYACLKLKLAGDLSEDCERVRQVRHAVGETTRLTVDPNMSYRAKEAISLTERIAEFDVEMIEQPVDASDLSGLAQVTGAASIAVEADESAFSPASTFHLAAGHIVDAVSLKVTKMGGLRNVLAAARICEAARLGCRMGATVGSQLLVAHAVHLCASLPNLTFPSELAEFLHIRKDPFEGLTVKDGVILVPEGPGSGVRLRNEAGLTL